MTTNVLGLVKDGVIVPNTPLPEGTPVEIRVLDEVPEVSPELGTELAQWQLAAAASLELVEQLAQETEAHETR